MTKLRDYPIVHGENILMTYDYYKSGGMDTREAWETAEHYHRSHLKLQEKIKHIDHLIPYQDDIFFKKNVDTVI